MNDPKLDRVVIKYPGVLVLEFDEFLDKLERARDIGMIGQMRRWVGKGIKEYHYNVLIGDDEEGRVLIQYKHNSAERGDKDKYDVRVEYNPQKINSSNRSVFSILYYLAWENVIYSIPEPEETDDGKYKWREKRYHFDPKVRRKILITKMDFAWDIPVDRRKIHCKSKNGRKQSSIADGETRYFGSRGEHGYMKIYDKKAERKKKGVEIEEETLTRVEFSWKGEQPLERLHELKVDVDGLYELYIVKSAPGTDQKKMNKYLACWYAIEAGLMDWKDFTRSDQKNIKKMLLEWEQIELNGSIEKQISTIANELVAQLV